MMMTSEKVRERTSELIGDPEIWTESVASPGLHLATARQQPQGNLGKAGKQKSQMCFKWEKSKKHFKSVFGV